MKLMKRVLVVDDDPVVGKSFERVLAPKGYAVISAADGIEALDRLAHEDYDMVYTDLKMPGLSGIEVARRVRASQPWLPVVIVTGYGNNENEDEARRLGVSAFLHKPVAPQAIEDMTAELTVDEPLATARFVGLEETPAPKEEAVPATAGTWVFVRNVGLFFAAPVIGFVYMLLGPIVGLGMLAWIGGKSIIARAKARRG